MKDFSSKIVNRNKIFRWDIQEDLLLAELAKSSDIEMEIRQATNKAIEDLKLKGVKDTEYNRYEICNLLKKAGYNCTICKSKWKSSLDMLFKEHTYLEVVTKTNSEKTKEEDIKIIVELDFQEEFVISRPNKEYNDLVSLLPKVFIGKFGRLKTIIKIVCGALEECMKEKNLIVCPWRTEEYMLAKWQKRYDKPLLTELPTYSEKRRSTAKVSLLTKELNFE